MSECTLKRYTQFGDISRLLQIVELLFLLGGPSNCYVKSGVTLGISLNQFLRKQPSALLALGKRQRQLAFMRGIAQGFIQHRKQIIQPLACQCRER